MQQHGSTYFARRHILDPGMGSKGQNIFFLKEVMLHIKLKGMGHRSLCKLIVCPYTHAWSLGSHCQINKRLRVPLLSSVINI